MGERGENVQFDIPSEPTSDMHKQHYILALQDRQQSTRTSSAGSSACKNKHSLRPTGMTASAHGRQRMTPLPRVSRLASRPAATITVHSFHGRSASVVAQFQLSWPEFLQYVTDRLNSDTAVRNLYTQDSDEIISKSDLVDGGHFYTATQEELNKVEVMTGLNRKKTFSQSPNTKSLISTDAHHKLIKSADKRMQRPYPLKITVRANRWTDHVQAPSRHCKEVLVKGTFTNSWTKSQAHWV